VKKLLPFYKPAAFVGILLLLAACNANTTEIAKLLDTRNTAMNERNISMYADILADDYHANGRSKEDVLLQMYDLFKRFQHIQMQTHNRHIDMIDHSHALCEQSYSLKVMADHEWRTIVQKEQLELTKQGNTWKISGGL